MEFVKEFATVLYNNGAIKFGNFTLSSGKKSSYYVDLRLIPSFPHQFRKMIKKLQSMIMEDIGLENFDTFASIPTGGLVVASALSFETLKPLLYVRSKAKEYGTSKSIEGKFSKGMKIVMIDDVATTGSSLSNGIKILQEAGAQITDAYVIINRMEGADDLLKSQGVITHQLTDIVQITESLNKLGVVNEETLNTVKSSVKSR